MMTLPVGVVDTNSISQNFEKWTGPSYYTHNLPYHDKIIAVNPATVAVHLMKCAYVHGFFIVAACK